MDLEEELDEEQAGEDEEIEVLGACFSVLNMSGDGPRSQVEQVKQVHYYVPNNTYVIQKKRREWTIIELDTRCRRCAQRARRVAINDGEVRVLCDGIEPLRGGSAMPPSAKHR